MCNRANAYFMKGDNQEATTDLQNVLAISADPSLQQKAKALLNQIDSH